MGPPLAHSPRSRIRAVQKERLAMKLLDLCCGAGGTAISLDVSPRFSSNDRGDCFLIQTIVSRQSTKRSSSHSFGSEMDDIILSQFRGRIGGSYHDLAASPPSLSHVCKIVLLGTYEKMCWVATERVVACMSDDGIRWRLSVHYLPCYTVRLKVSTKPPELPVPIGATRCHPRPTLIRVPHTNLGPKLLLQGLCVSHADSIPEAHHHV